jgi:hypothetical protein
LPPKIDCAFQNEREYRLVLYAYRETLSKPGDTMRPAKLLLALICTTTLVGTAGTAYADGNDDAFLEALNEVGIEYPNADQVVASGKAVCSYIIAGRHTENETIEMVSEQNPKLTPVQAIQFVNLARGAYCPLPPMGGGGGG